jgi:U3 small nucleolar RNA-associated protein 5
MFEWIREIVVVHGGYLVSQGEDVKEILLRLRGTLDRRGQSWERLVRLKGRLELLRAVKGQEGTTLGREPEVRWVEDEEGEEGEEPEIEDVRYLTGDIGEEDIEEVPGQGDGEVEDVEMENGIQFNDEGEEDEDEEDEEDEEDDEESSDEQVETAKKVNGVPHFSDSEDSAVDLDDLIDDEASEASNDNSDEEEEEEEAPPPAKKSKSRR